MSSPGQARTCETDIPAPGEGHLRAERGGSGTPAVLLHGAGTDSRLWDTVFPALARHHDVIRYDARGLGRSTPPTRSFWDVADLTAVLDHFHLDRAALIGLSMGGETALDFALAHPARVTALALVATSVSGHQWPQTPELSAYARARHDGDAARLADLELSIWAPLGAHAAGDDLITTMVRHNAQRRITSEHFALYPDQDAVSLLDQIAAPTLVIHGDRDHPEIGSIAERLTTGIPGARGEIVPDADHYLPLRAPDRLTELLLAHLP